MFCKHCGQRLGREDKFCARCGEAAPQEEIETDASHAPLPESADLIPPSPRPSSGVSVKILDLNFDPAPVAPAKQLDREETLPIAEPAVAAAPGKAPRTVVRRKSSIPVIELLVAALLVLGAVTAIWIFRSTLPRKTIPAKIVVAVDPVELTLRAGKPAELAASVSGTENLDIVWSVAEGDAGGRIVPRGAKAEAGKVVSLATYTAPRKPGTYHVVATSKADAGSAATSEIHVRK